MSNVFMFGAPPSAPADMASVEFMEKDLGRSKLIPPDLAAYPIASTKFDAPAYVIPYPGNADGLYRVRIDRKDDKYIAKRGVPPDLWIPPGTDLMEMYDGDLWIVEGEKKAAAVHKHWGLSNVVGIGGCWNAIMKAPDGTYSLIPNLQHLCVAGRTVHLILDGDVIQNRHVGKAASTLHMMMGNLNCQLILYRPPLDRWKGVDDWIAEVPITSPNGLQVVPFDQLAANRTILYEQLGCSLSEKGGLILNETNGLKLLKQYFTALGIVADKRLGFFGRDKREISPDGLFNQAINYLQVDINPRYSASACSRACQMYQTDAIRQDLVQEFIKILKWDGIPRLESWGSQYFESGFDKLANEWGRILFTGLVFRILEPGCKFDTVCILNGPQGIGKTTFFQALSVIDGFDFYRDIEDLPGTNGDDRTFKQALIRALIIDLSEGIIFDSRKTSQDRLKMFITQPTDEYRVAYARGNTIVPRGYIFVGTTNRGDQLSDMTGSRRFLYLNVSKIKRLEYATKLQILAEVAARQEEIKSGPWWDLRLTMEDMPQTLREENPHIKSVSELLNVEHYRADSMTELILQVIGNGDLPTFKATGQMLLSTHYIAHLLQTNNHYQTANTVARKFVELNGSEQFPFRLERKMLRVPQINFQTPHQEVIYKGQSNNVQQQITTFVVIRK